MRPEETQRRARKRSPFMIALGLYLLVGTGVGASLLLKGAQPEHRHADPEYVDREGPRVAGHARLASFQQDAKPADDKAAEAKKPKHPEGKDSESCVSCHFDVEPSHEVDREFNDNTGTCVSCHGGNGKIVMGKDGAMDKNKALYHVAPRFPKEWGKAAKKGIKTGWPERTYALLNRESIEFVQFVNPGDLRVAHVACGACHAKEVLGVRKSMMTHGGFLYGAALYNNGVLPTKDPILGESYSAGIWDKEKKRWDPRYAHSLPQALQGVPVGAAGEARLPTPEESARGVLPALFPLPRWEVSQVANIFRVFERGGSKKLPQSEVGNPTREEEPGRPDDKNSSRGHGTILRTEPIVLGAQKTRLLDPTMNFLGTNDKAGDYRASGCSSCHNVYANDRDPAHSAHYAKYGHSGQSFTRDSALGGAEPDEDPKAKLEPAADGETGHPIGHTMTRKRIPTSQCITCHMHPGTNMLTTYLGYTWWDNEMEADKGMYPVKPRELTDDQKDKIQQFNPEGSALKGNWGDPKFLANVTDLNPKLKSTQFADFNGHGWVFRAVYKRDRKGNLLDKDGKIVSFDDPKRFDPKNPNSAVHLKDIHLERGMHCVDCHFKQDSHGDGKLYSEPRAATEITCQDCHGTVTKKSTILDDDGVTLGPAGGNKWSDYNYVEFKPAATTDDLPKRWYKKDDGTLWQRSAVTDGMEWPVVQLVDLVDPKHKNYNKKAALAKTIRRDGRTWGSVPPDGAAGGGENKLAHDNNDMACFACHTSWTTSCFGCHLSMTANQKKRNNHYDGSNSRNWTSYNFQTLRDDLYMLGKDGVNTGNKVAPIRSSCAVLVSSQNQQRDWLYYQQQTTAASGHAGTAFSSYVPHTVRGKETKGCTDCHVSDKNDNNAWMANLLLQGTNSANHIGRYAYVANETGISAVMVAERDEPTAVIGSFLHKFAYPNEYGRHLDRGRELKTAHDHHGESLMVQLRGEYLYSAEGPKGTVIYDVANVDNKGFSERILTAPVSPWGQRFFVRSKYAVAVASPSTMLIDPARKQVDANKEQPIHPLYGYLYILDREEGLIVVKAHTLMDGNPTNNFLSRSKLGATKEDHFNPTGILNGGTSIQIAGSNAYITCDRGLVIVDISNPTAPRVIRVIDGFKHAYSVQVQFRYAFVTDHDGLKVVDITTPESAFRVKGAEVHVEDLHGLYLCRTYAYAAAGKNGLAIIDIENPERPKLDQIFNAGGQINDAHDVKIGTTYNSTYAYVADGHNGLRVIQLTAPDTTPGIYGYSPRPNPQLIATYETAGPAMYVSEGLDRDRAVDESGNQLAVFGRKGARPFNLAEQRRMYLLNGNMFKVSDDFPSLPTYAQSNAPRGPARLSFTDGLFLLPAAGLFLARRNRRGWIRIARRTRRGWILLTRRSRRR